MLQTPDGFPSLPDAIHTSGIYLTGLRTCLDDYLIDLRMLVNEEISHMDDPLAYISARDFLNAVEQMRMLLEDGREA